MAQHNQHLTCLHEILRRNASSQMMFAFVRGVLACNDNITIPDALRKFEEAFGIEDFNHESARSMYYKMLREFIKQNKIFNHDQSKAPRRQRERVH